MIRLGKNVFSSVLATLTALSLAACGGGGHHGSALPPAAQAPSGLSPDAFVTATFTIKIPAPTTTSAKSRRPSYISAATKWLRVNMTADSAGVPITSQFNVLAQVTNPTGTSPSTPAPSSTPTAPGTSQSSCTGAGPWTCTVTVNVPPGSDTFSFTTYDDSGGNPNHVLSQQIQTLTIVKAVANAFTITFDANANTIALSGTQPCTQGSIAGVFGSGQGTTPVTINVSFTDPAGQTITAGPTLGGPTIEIKDADGTYHTGNGVIHGTGGDANFSINNSARSFTLTPTAVPLSNVPVDVKGVPANTTGSSDGLSFPAGADHQFTFSAGVPPPTHNFLAVIEQNAAQTSGQINFFTYSTGPDKLTAWSTTATLTSTNSINQNQPDVDNPESLVFDSGSNLLIANGGQGGAGGDFGNFACVPSGAISTGAALSTTNTTNLLVPDAIAVSSDGTVAVANNSGSATKNVQDFTLGTNYVAGSSYTNPGTFGVPFGRPLVNLPTLTAGTFAFGIFDGTNSKLVIIGPTGLTSTVTNSQDSAINDPFAMAWDGFNNQLVVGDNATPGSPTKQSYLSFWTVSNPTTAPVKVKSFMIQPDPDPADDCVSAQPCAGMAAQKIAVAPTSGYVAVAGINSYNSTYGGGEIQIYDSSHNPLANGVIAFDGANSATIACGSVGAYDPTTDYVYGESGIFVTDLQWLSSTKLLVLLKQPNKTAVQGLYIYDVSATAAQSGFWGPWSGGSCHSTAVPNGPQQTFFLNVTPLQPLAATYKI